MKGGTNGTKYELGHGRRIFNLVYESPSRIASRSLTLEEELAHLLF